MQPRALGAMLLVAGQSLPREDCHTPASIGLHSISILVCARRDCHSEGQSRIGWRAVDLRRFHIGALIAAGSLMTLCESRKDQVTSTTREEDRSRCATA